MLATGFDSGMLVKALWKSLWIFPVVFCFVLGFALVDPKTGLRTYWQMRSEVRDAKARIAVLEQETEALRREAELLAKDPFTIEQAIREDLGLARPGEVIVKLPGEKKFPFLDGSSVETESTKAHERTTTP